MKIEIMTTFLDGRDRFESGDVRTVSDEDGERFVAAGWAAPIDTTTGLPTTAPTIGAPAANPPAPQSAFDGEVSPPSVGEVTLNVQSVAHAQKVKING